MAIKLRYLDTAKGLSPYELELINNNYWMIEQALNSVGAASPLVPGSGTPPISDHHLLTNLTTFDDHPQYAYLAGRSVSPTWFGGLIAGQNITLRGNAADTLGAGVNVIIGNTSQGGIVVEPTAINSGGEAQLLRLQGRSTGGGSTGYLNATEGGSFRIRISDYNSWFYGNGTTTGTIFGSSEIGFEYNLRLFSFGTTVIPLTIRGLAGQTANLLEWQDSTPTILAYVDKDAYIASRRFLMLGSTSGILTHIAPAAITDYSLTWPDVQSVGIGVLTNDGSGNLTWAAGVGAVEFADNVFRIYDDGTTTKKLAFQCSGIAAATTRTWTVQNANGTVALLNGITQSWATTQNFLGAVNVSDTLFTLNDAGFINTLQFTATNAGIVLDSPASSGVIALTTDILTTVRRNSGANIGSRPRLNFIEGTDIVLTITDDPGNNEVDIQIESTAGSGSGTFVLAETEQDLGTPARKGGTFDITGLSSLTTDRQVVVIQKAAPFTDKGILKDHGELDHVLVTAYVLNATTVRCHWFSATFVQGNFKFGYVVSG